MRLDTVVGNQIQILQHGWRKGYPNRPVYSALSYFLILQLRTSGPSVVSVPCIQENNVTTYQKLEEYWVKNILDISKKQNFGIDWENFKILKSKIDNIKWTLAKCVTFLKVFLTRSFRYRQHSDFIPRKAKTLA